MIGFFVFQKNFHKKIDFFLVKRYIARPPRFPLCIPLPLSIYLSLVLDWMLSERVSDGNSDVKEISMSMKLALNRAEMARESLIQATDWLDAKGVYYRHLPPSQLKIGPINYWPSTGTITVDNEPGKRVGRGLQGLELVLDELQGRYPVRRFSGAC